MSGTLPQKADDASAPLVSVVIQRSGAVRLLILSNSDGDETLARRALERLGRLWGGGRAGHAGGE